MGYKLIALDIDGTIRDIHSPISHRTRRAVAGAREAGATVTLATGRTFRSAARNSAELGIDAPIAAAQGAYICKPDSEEPLRYCTMTAEMVRDALDALDGCDMQIVAYYHHDIYVNRMTEWAEGYKQRNNIKVHVVGDLREVADVDLTRLVVVGDEGEIERLESRLKSEFQSRLHITRSLPHFCEILHPDGGKDKALAWMCDYLGIQRSEIIAFGNGYNDVQMLNWVALGIAVGDAVPEALAAADRVAPPLDQHGVAQMLEELLDSNLIG